MNPFRYFEVIGATLGFGCLQPHTEQITIGIGPDGRSRGSPGMNGTNVWGFAGLVMKPGRR
jgi:hypothetical protein